MTSSEKASARLRFHRQAYEFVLEALNRAQESHGRAIPDEDDSPFGTQERERHVTGPQLLEGFRKLALEEFGGLALTVLHQWGLRCTNDVGYIVWEMIEQGRMRKTNQDQLEDFFDVYQFEQAFGSDAYPLNVSGAFKRTPTKE